MLCRFENNYLLCLIVFGVVVTSVFHQLIIVTVTAATAVIDIATAPDIVHGVVAVRTTIPTAIVTVVWTWIWIWLDCADARNHIKYF